MLQQRFDIPVTAIYGSDFSVAGYHDSEFQATFAWDTDLLSGYMSLFLSRVAEGGRDSPSLVSTRGLKGVLQSLAPRAVLLVGYSPRFHQMAFYQAWRGGYPTLFRGETTDHARPRGWAYSAGRDQVLRCLYHRCSRLLYVGRRSYEHFKRLGCSDEKLVFSPYCVDTSAFETSEADRLRLRSQMRESLGVAPRQKVLLFSGKLSARKSPRLLLEAVKELPGEIREDFLVVFVGDGELREELQRFAQRSPSVKVSFAGFQNQTCLSQYYHAADLLVLPSRHSETWGLVVNEALHHGLPCVVSDSVGCAQDLIEVGVTGEIFSTGSCQSLVGALQRALLLKGRPEIRLKCRQKVSHYTVEEAAEGVARAYWAVTEHANRVARYS